MNISKKEQRVLHVLAQGGRIRFERATNGKLTEVQCFTHDGMIYADCTVRMVSGLVQKGGLIKSVKSQPYRISILGRRSVRPRMDNRT